MALRRNPPAYNPREGVVQYLKKESRFAPKYFSCRQIGRYIYRVPGLLGPKSFQPGTPRPKSIFLLGLFGPGLLGPDIKILYLWHTMENKCISGVFYFNIRFSTIGKRNVKKGKHIFIQTNVFFYFMWDISA